jgi:hypothetical protein
MRLFFIFILLFVSLYANHVRWFASYEKAHLESLRVKKPLMVLMLKDNSKASIAVIQKVFMNQPYIDYINENFIPVVILKDQKETYPFEMLYTLKFPSLFFLNDKELFIKKQIRGNVTSEKLRRCLKSKR